MSVKGLVAQQCNASQAKVTYKLLRAGQGPIRRLMLFGSSLRDCYFLLPPRGLINLNGCSKQVPLECPGTRIPRTHFKVSVSSYPVPLALWDILDSQSQSLKRVVNTQKSAAQLDTQPAAIKGCCWWGPKMVWGDNGLREAVGETTKPK